MSKQYTFKTTKNTEWIEEVLDALPGRDRSEFIRDAITLQLQKMGYEVPTYKKWTFSNSNDIRSLVTRKRVSYRVVNEEREYSSTAPFIPMESIEEPKVTPQKVRHPEVRQTSDLIEPTFEEVSSDIEDVDLDSKLDSLYD